MLQRSSFVRAAVNKPWYTYLYTLTSIAPVHVIGLVGTVVLTLCSMPTVIERVVYGLNVLCGSDSEIAYIKTADDNNTAVGSVASNEGKSNVTAGGFNPTTPVDQRASLRRRCKEPSLPPAIPAPTSVGSLNPPLPTQTLPPPMLPQVHSSSDTVDPFVLTLLLFSLWPVGFLVGLTVLGSAGSGFQSRFMMPMLPGSAILSALCLQWVHRAWSSLPYNDRIMSTACSVVMGVLMMYSVVHVFYYGVLYAPLFADLDVSLVDILCSVLQSVYSAPASREEFRGTVRFMGHYGLVRETS